MKKLLILACVSALILLTGCKSFFETTKDKGINANSNGFGIDFSTGVSSTNATPMPRFFIGWLTVVYQSLPEVGGNNRRVYYKTQSGSWLYPQTVKNVTVSSIEVSDSPLAANIETELEK